eukprot:3053579-Karenia_brevis.AAC.1
MMVKILAARNQAVPMGANSADDDAVSVSSGNSAIDLLSDDDEEMETEEAAFDMDMRAEVISISDCSSDTSVEFIGACRTEFQNDGPFLDVPPEPG